MATKSLDGYKLGVVLDASGAAKGIAALKEADKQATKTYSSLQNLSKGFKLGLADKFKSELKEVEGLSRSSAVGQMLGRAVGTGLTDGISSVFNAKTLGSLIGTAFLPGVGTAAGSVIGGAVDTLVSKVSGPLMGLAEQGVELNKQLEVTQVHFTALTGDADGAGKLLKQIKELSARAGLDLPTILQGENRLEEFNSDLKISVLELNAAADASRLFGSGVGGFNAIVDSLGLIAEKGELSSKVITRLYKQGVDVVGILSDASGKSRDWVKKRIAAGNVDGEWAAKTIAEGIEIQKRARANALVNSTTQGQQDRFAALTALRAQEGTVAATGALKDMYAGGNALLDSAGAQKFTSFINDAAASLIKLTKSAFETGKDATSGLIKGMLSVDLTGGVTGFVEKTLVALRSEAGFDSHSPARKMIPVGEDAAEGVIVGFEEYMNTKGRRRLTTSVDGLTKKQIDIAKRIVDIGRARGATDKQIRAAVSTAYTESRLRDLRGGDRDSAGVMQQRPSQGWGTYAQVTNVDYAANKFYDVAAKVRGQDRLTPGQLAQRVQRSAFPLRYDQNLPIADALISRLSVNNAPVSAANPMPVYVAVGAKGVANVAPSAPKEDVREITAAIADAKPAFQDLPILSNNLHSIISAIPLAAAPFEAGLLRGAQGMTDFSSTTDMAVDRMSVGVSKLDDVFASLRSITGLVPSQQVGKKRGLFSKILGFAAPFLSFLPGGQVLSALAGIGSRALGGDYGGALEGVASGFSKGGAFRSTPHSQIGDVSTGGKADLPGKALGGPVRKGRAYVVGEYRNEIFEPNEDGWVHPSVASYLRSRDGRARHGFFGGFRDGFEEQLLAALDRHAAATAAFTAKYGHIQPGQLLAAGAKSSEGQQAIAEGYHGHLRRSPKDVEFITRKTNGQ